VPAVHAAQLRLRGSLELTGVVTAHGEVNLLGARIGGMLDLRGARLTNPDGYALIADGLTVAGSMRCCDGFTAQGEVRLAAARIGGQLHFTGPA
jgi:hypothetical protein